jgi:SPX domain protein involved in polyphosphate accumulation
MLWKIFLEFDNIILEEKLSNKFNNGHEKFPEIFYFTDLREEVLKKFPKTVLKTRLKNKETTHNLVFIKYLVVSLRSHSIRAFSVFLEISLRIISRTCGGIL